MEHSVNEYVEEEDEVIDGEGSEDGDSNDDDDMDDQDWWAPHTFHYYDLILVLCNVICVSFWNTLISNIFHIFSICSVLFQTFWL